MAGDPVLSVRGLHVEFPTDDGIVTAVDDVSFDVLPDEVLGIVGESGAGKTVTALSILGLLPKRARVRGEVAFDGRDLLTLRERDLQGVRGARIAIVFQDALDALNPVLPVGRQVAEAITVHRKASANEAEKRAVELLDVVGIANARRRAEQYPHEYSGGMRQRVLIAMALANGPDVLIADEPTTALDVTIQAQVLDVFERVRERMRSSLVLITHDLGVVAGFADRVMVMYAGRQAEIGVVDGIFYESRHPYTLGLWRRFRASIEIAAPVGCTRSTASRRR
jgi:ABC-type dipeptide/oligopeptide/nickel transport system ATPase component